MLEYGLDYLLVICAYRSLVCTVLTWHVMSFSGRCFSAAGGDILISSSRFLEKSSFWSILIEFCHYGR